MTDALEPQLEPMPTEVLRALLSCHRERYEQQLRAGRSAGWSCDQRTLDVWSLGQFLDEWFVHLPGERRRLLGHAFSRMVRSAEDVWVVAAQVLLVGERGLDIELYSSQYWTARNHGKWDR